VLDLLVNTLKEIRFNPELLISSMENKSSCLLLKELISSLCKKISYIIPLFNHFPLAVRSENSVTLSFIPFQEMLVFTRSLL